MPRESGQSLIEVVITLTITVVVLGALVITVLTSMRNAQFAQNQARATKYAQEAIDQIRSIRDRNGLITFASTSNPTCCIPLPLPNPAKSCRFSNPVDTASVWRCNLSPTDPCTVNGGSSRCYLKISDTKVSLNEVDSNIGDSVYESLENGVFLRQIIMENGSSALEKKVTVKVLWRDASGDHESFLQTYLTRY